MIDGNEAKKIARNETKKKINGNKAKKKLVETRPNKGRWIRETALYLFL